MENHIFLLILLFLVQYYSVSGSASSSNETDQQALLVFKDLVTSPSHFLANNWTKNTSFCSWFGVTCSPKRQRVVPLAFPDMQLQGTISSSLVNLSFLSMLNLQNNSFHGGIPYGLGHLPRLVLNLRNNSLTGIIPPSIGNATKLMNFSLAGNRISGNLPKEIKLKILSISFNNIIGDIPRNIGCLSKLEEFYIGHNPIKGTIPASLGNISTLQNLYCALNYLEGPIPPELAKLSNLWEINFFQNKLIGQIPEAIFNISSLKNIGFNLNNLSGRIPTTTGLHLPNLVYLVLGGNQLEGEIPLFITNASKLEILDLAGNFLTGTIPTNLGNLHELQRLLLHSSNLLNGVLPNSVGNLSSTIEYFHLEDARINGLIPPGIGNMSGLIILVFENNNLMGNIPPEIGTIPFSLSKLINLEFLDLSLNVLSGTIPKSLEKLLHLTSINVSFNDLEGEIPNGGVFTNFTLQSFLGNKRLCGIHILEVINNTGQQSNSKEFVLKIVIPVVTSSFLIFLLVSVWIMKCKKKRKSTDVEIVPEVGTYQLISYHEIQRATNNFGGSNLIGEGSSGFVYKGTLSSGTVVAIKVLDLEKEQVCKRFDTECEVMRNVRHRNLVSVITTCSSDYIRAFVLQYMSNGSLENWLYREDCQLNLLQRVTVMFDAAMGIEYLHHGYITPIVHCDLKPANILLDDDMMAHVGDFGISKILAVSKSMAYTETLGTLGYIAPEYGLEGIVSTSGDVYSYGIMLMEVLTKRRPTDEEIWNENRDLRKWITQSISGSMVDVIDDKLFPEEEKITSKSEICIASMIELALDCTKETPESRITMEDVVKRLNKIKNAFLEI
ncbi:putative LRR receptor-like serine/threonine-protein kinase-like [Capsicum annuum]|nr:putative LRR receptor-like serine/threonine-protein kinase-like [Capsicum annuum]